MTYERQTWTNGETVLDASTMTHLEDGIVANDAAVAALADEVHLDTEEAMTVASGIDWRSGNSGTVRRVGSMIVARGQFNASSAWGSSGSRATVPSGYEPPYEVPIPYTIPGANSTTVDMWIAANGDLRASATAVTSGYIKFFVVYPAKPE